MYEYRGLQDVFFMMLYGGAVFFALQNNKYISQRYETENYYKHLVAIYGDFLLLR